MKLYVDDIRNAPDDTWHVCRTISASIRALDNFWPVVEEISLDHDISHQIGMGAMSRPYPCAETFEAVARYIAKIKHLNPGWNPKLHIHSSNLPGGQAMRQLLEDEGFTDVTHMVSKPANRLEMTDQ